MPPATTAPNFFHLCNYGTNAGMTYTHYDNGPNIRVPNDATAVLGGVTFAPARNNIGIAALLDNSNNCLSRGYGPTLGLRQPSGVTTTVNALYVLAQNVPNPCSGSTSVSYRVPAGAKSTQLVIRDSYSGRVWKRAILDAGEHTVDVPVSMLPPGAYHYSLEVDGRPVAHHQLLVQ